MSLERESSAGFYRVARMRFQGELKMRSAMAVVAAICATGRD